MLRNGAVPIIMTGSHHLTSECGFWHHSGLGLPDWLQHPRINIIALIVTENGG